MAAKIGVISIITGPGAGYGEAITNGFKLARDELNAKGEVKIDLIMEDSSGKQEQALAAAQKLINSQQVVAILGPTLSTEMKVVGPEANASGVPIMGTSTTAAGITQIGKYVFRNSLPESLAIPASVKKAVAKYNIKSVAMLYGNDDVFTKSGLRQHEKGGHGPGAENHHHRGIPERPGRLQGPVDQDQGHQTRCSLLFRPVPGRGRHPFPGPENGDQSYRSWAATASTLPR